MSSYWLLIVMFAVFYKVNSEYQQYQPPIVNPRFPYGVPLDYRITTSSKKPVEHRDPDSLWLGKNKLNLNHFYFLNFMKENFTLAGFFPIWSAVLVLLTGFCLLISLVGVFCWLIGMINPRRQLLKEASIIKAQQEEQYEQYYDDISMKMIDPIDQNNSTLFSNSRLMSDYGVSDPILNKKIFLKDNF
jgi:hypothetical protein